ncbi:DUF6313 family protein [Saccharothrix variisporea]|uniref:DUF6313 family protein n=1 Tax=Saccharothrix variisporea TaxID=543527 RepID=UPI000EB062FA|nr:DUF6313 family protein [Saccharothrix variisporea]
MSGEIRRSDADLEAWVRPGEVERAAGESPVERFRRWWRSRFRYAGIQYWLVTEGYVVVLVFAGLYVVNGLLLGWTHAYEVSALIASPWDVPAGVEAPSWSWVPALLLSIAGWLVVTGFAGAVAGYMVLNATTNRRGLKGSRVGPLPSGEIPRLADLQYSRHGHDVPPYFALRFALRHDSDWRRAQDHWERLVARFLHTDAFDRGDGNDGVMRQAVTYTSYFLHGLSGRCPECLMAKTGSEDADAVG